MHILVLIDADVDKHFLLALLGIGGDAAHGAVHARRLAILVVLHVGMLAQRNEVAHAESAEQAVHADGIEVIDAAAGECLVVVELLLVGREVAAVGVIMVAWLVCEDGVEGIDLLSADVHLRCGDILGQVAPSVVDDAVEAAYQPVGILHVPVDAGLGGRLDEVRAADGAVLLVEVLVVRVAQAVLRPFLRASCPSRCPSRSPPSW